MFFQLLVALAKEPDAASGVQVHMTQVRGLDRDGDLDNQIVAHEWGHYISNRNIHDGNGLDTKYKGNGIQVRHNDGTTAVYWHIRQGGSLVTKDQRVRQGQVIALSGNVPANP